MARPAPTPSPVAGFLALPALPSLLFPVSAACLAAGAWGVLGPAMDDPERFVERLAAVGVVLAYAGALAGAAWLLCRWQAANPDAIGVILLLAMVLAGGGLALDTIAYTSPLGALAMGLGLVAVAAGAARVLHRTVLPGGPGWAPAALVALAAWHGLGPALVGWWAGLEQALTDPADPLMGGWWLQLAAAWMVAWMPLANPADRPFLHRPMAWRVVLVAALVAGGLHTASQGWMVMLDLGWGDHLAWIAPVLLALWRDVPWTGAAGTGLRVLTALLPMAVLLAGATHAAHLPIHAAEGGLRGWGLAHGGWLGLPAVTGGLVAVWAAVQGWRRRDPAAGGLAVAALAAGLAVIPGHGRLFCDGIPALLVLAGGLAAWAALCRRWPWITLIAALGGFTAYAWIVVHTPLRARPDLAWGVAGAFALPLLAGAVHPALWPAEVRRLTAAVLGILGAVWAGHGQAAAAIAVAAPLIAGWRGRDWGTAAGALLPAAPAAFHWPGWSAMAGAFALIGAGLAASRRRLQRPNLPAEAAPVDTAEAPA